MRRVSVQRIQQQSLEIARDPLMAAIREQLETMLASSLARERASRIEDDITTLA